MERMDAIRDPDLPLHRCFKGPLDLSDHTCTRRLVPLHDWLWACPFFLPKAGLLDKTLCLGLGAIKHAELPPSFRHGHGLPILLLCSIGLILVYGGVPDHAHWPLTQRVTTFFAEQDWSVSHCGEQSS